LSNQGWQDGGVKIEKMKTEVRSQESEWGRRSQNIGNTGVWKRGPQKEAVKIGIMELKAVAGRKRWVGRRVDLGKGGRVAGKRTGFSHLCPDDSMQVVDFPLLSRLRVFWLRVERGGGQWTVDNWQWIANSGNESNRTNGTNLARSTVQLNALKCG